MLPPSRCLAALRETLLCASICGTTLTTLRARADVIPIPPLPPPRDPGGIDLTTALGGFFVLVVLVVVIMLRRNAGTDDE